MRLDFDEVFQITTAEGYDYCKTPNDWPRLFKAFTKVTERGDGWFAVSMRRSPLPLIVKISIDQPGEHVAWDLAGFWKGDGEVRFETVDGGTRITGHETITLPGPFGLGRLMERVFKPGFAAIWEDGWRRLRRRNSPT